MRITYITLQFLASACLVALPFMGSQILLGGLHLQVPVGAATLELLVITISLELSHAFRVLLSFFHTVLALLICHWS